MSWKIDPAHSEINFTVRHLMISNVRGRFEKFSGDINFDIDNPAASTLDVSIDAASINTKEPQRDGHLRSPDFFDAEKFPSLTYKGTRFEVLDPSHGKIYGDLAIRGVAHQVVLDVEYSGMAKSPWGNTSAGFSATTKINRKDWGLNWNQALESGGVLVGDEIKIAIEVEIIQQVEPEMAAVA
jgi:polyisoprenoid-binding protein YceI